MEYIGKATEVVKHFRVRLSHCSSVAQQLCLRASRFDSVVLLMSTDPTRRRPSCLL